jgi:hypothetical protein
MHTSTPEVSRTLLGAPQVPVSSSPTAAAVTLTMAGGRVMTYTAVPTSESTTVLRPLRPTFDNQSPQMAKIVGGALAGLAVVLAVYSVFFCRRRRRLLHLRTCSSAQFSEPALYPSIVLSEDAEEKGGVGRGAEEGEDETSAEGGAGREEERTSQERRGSEHWTESARRSSERWTESDRRSSEHRTGSDRRRSEHRTEPDRRSSEHRTGSDRRRSEHRTESDRRSSEHRIESERKAQERSGGAAGDGGGRSW